MSLNDPHWGRDSSDKEPKKEETKNTSNSTDTEEDGFKEPELRRPIEDKREEKIKQALGQENDIEELWKDFNDKLSGILGQKSKRPQDRGQNGVNFNWNDSDDDSNEPPPRKDHPSKQTKAATALMAATGAMAADLDSPAPECLSLLPDPAMALLWRRC